MNSKRRHLTLSIVHCCQPPCCSYRTNLLPTSLFGRHQEHPPQRYRRRSRFHCDNVLLVAAEVHCIFQPFSLRAGPDMCNHTRMPHRRTPTSSRSCGVASPRSDRYARWISLFTPSNAFNHVCVAPLLSDGPPDPSDAVAPLSATATALRGSLQSPDPTLPLHSATILRSRLFSHQMCKSS